MASIFIISIIVLAFILLKNKESSKNEFSILEKRWLEKNESKVIDISIINDVPLLGEEGEGVFFDFIKDLSKETKLNFNLLPYSLNTEPKSKKYYFQESNKIKLKDNQLLFCSDNYVIVSKDNNRVKNIKDIEDSIVGVLENDLSKIKLYLFDDKKNLYNSYNDIRSIVKALNNNDIIYAVIPKNLYINEIFTNNYYIVYDIPEISTSYVFTNNGSNKVLNSIIEKYYSKWKEKKLEKSYNEKLLDLYFNDKDIDDVSRTNFKSKEYVYGFVKNYPYESKKNNNFIGFNSELIDEFSNNMGITFKIKEYNSISALSKALDEGKVDIAFNYYNFSNLDKNNFDYTFSPYNEKAVVLTSINNTETSVSSFNSLRRLDISMVENKIYNYFKNNYDLSIKKYKNSSSLFNKLNDESVVVVDSNLYDYYKNSELRNFKVIYSDVIDTDYNFIINNSTRNKSFIGLFKFYISTNNSSVYQSRAYAKMQNDKKMINMNYVYISLVAIVIVIIVLFYYRKKKNTNSIKTSEKVRYVDHLTSLKNRNYLNQNYQKWQNNKIYPQAIIIIELNKIGHINDVYGHEEGDTVIKKAANILISNQLEQSDIVRTNGDEFLIYLVGYEESKIIAYMRKLFKEFKKLPYNFGVQLGYSMILDDIKTIDDAMNEAVLEIKTSKEVNTDNE